MNTNTEAMMQDSIDSTDALAWEIQSADADAYFAAQADEIEASNFVAWCEMREEDGEEASIDAYEAYIESMIPDYA